MILSENTDQLFEALAKFQKDAPTIVKDKTVKVKNKSGKFLYSFDYASLGNIINTVKEPLAKQGLSVSQGVGTEGVRTIIMHESGQYMISDALQTDLEGDEQDQGSSITYKKRYQLSAMLNLDSEFDDDGNRASGNVPDFEDDPRGEPEPIEGKGGSSTKAEKDPEPEPEDEDEAPFDLDDADDVQEVLNNAKDPMDLINWWKDFLDEGDEQEKIDKYREDVMEKLNKLQS